MILFAAVLLAVCSNSITTAQFMGFMPNFFGGDGGGFGGFGLNNPFSGMGNYWGPQQQPNDGFGGPFGQQSSPNLFGQFGGPFGGQPQWRGQGPQGQDQSFPSAQPQQQQGGPGPQQFQPQQQQGVGPGGQQGQQPGFGGPGSGQGQQSFGPQQGQQQPSSPQQGQQFNPQQGQQFNPQQGQQQFNPQQGQQPFGPQNFQQPNFGGPNSQFGRGFQQRMLECFKPFGGGGATGQQVPLPDVSNISQLIRGGDFFFDSNPFYRTAVRQLRTRLNGITDPAQLADTISQLQNTPDLNRQVWLRASVGALLRRTDISNFRIPALLEVDPGFVLQTETVNSVQQQAQLPQDQRQCVVVDGNVGQDNGVENALWYFREDVMVNSHHWFWHLSYPMSPLTRMDRSGELFYFMHHSVLARYNAERLSNGMNRALPLVLGQGVTIDEGYNPHLTQADSQVPWAPRRAGTPLPQNTQTFMNMSLADAIAVHTRLSQAVDSGTLLLPQGNTLSLNNFAGIDSLGVTIEANAFSVNPDYYSRLGHHNNGHVIISNAANPGGNAPPGVMADTSTSMRDIVFYRWHTGVDQLFSTYKDRLPAYQPSGGDFPLGFPGVSITNFQVLGRVSTQTPNTVTTFWTTTNVNLDNGLDFFRNPQSGTVPLCVRHLDHEGFDYQFTIQKDPSQTATRAAVRIFMAPRLNEQGQRFTLQEQRSFLFIMDTFSVTLQDGANPVVRRSEDSALTISWPQSVTELNTDQNRTSAYCGCGWPRHLLVPRGAPGGMPFDLFAMVTSETDGQIPAFNQVANDDDQCEVSYIFCGFRGRAYPDTKPMGYPFDRLPYSVATAPNQQGGGGGSRMVQSLEEYVAGLPNTAAVQLQIVHNAG